MKSSKEEMKVKRVLSKAQKQPKIIRHERTIFWANLVFGIIFSIAGFVESEDVFLSFWGGMTVFVVLYIFTRYIWCVITLRLFYNNEYFALLADSHEQRMDELKSASWSNDSDMKIENFWFAILLIIPLIFRGIKRLFLAIVEFFRRYIILFKVCQINRNYRKDRRVVRKKYDKSTLYVIDNVPLNGVFRTQDDEIEIDIDKRRIRGKACVSGGNAKYVEIYIDDCKSMKMKVDYGVDIWMVDRTKKGRDRKVGFKVPYVELVKDGVYEVKSFPAKETYDLVMLLKKLYIKQIRISGSKRKIRRRYKMAGVFFLEGDDCMFKSRPR